MNTAYLCVLLAAVMPILLAGAAKFGGMRKGVLYDNSAPRESLSRLDGWPQRANWAQQNSWEAFMVFVAAVLVALQSGQPSAVVGVWAAVFIVARLGYAVCYLLNLASLRSIFWLAGFGICLRLMVSAI